MFATVFFIAGVLIGNCDGNFSKPILKLFQRLMLEFEHKLVETDKTSHKSISFILLGIALLSCGAVTNGTTSKLDSKSVTGTSREAEKTQKASPAILSFSNNNANISNNFLNRGAALLPVGTTFTS